jgi:hypothetical protein
MARIVAAFNESCSPTVNVVGSVLASSPKRMRWNVTAIRRAIFGKTSGVAVARIPRRTSDSPNAEKEGRRRTLIPAMRRSTSLSLRCRSGMR